MTLGAVLLHVPIELSDSLEWSFRQAPGNSWPDGSAYYVPMIAAGKLPDMAAGEAMHQKGAEGARRAKRWLDATTRTRTSWVNEDTVRAGKLEFPWPHGGESFSFDVGGMLIGQPFDWHNFVAEVKFYSGDDLGPPFDDFLAKCFVVRKLHTTNAEQFMFLTWHPFRIKTWTKLCQKETIVSAIKKHAKHIYDIEPPDAKDESDGAKAVRAQIDAVIQADTEAVEELERRLWLVVLSEKQEELLISAEDRALINKVRTEAGLL